MGWTIPNSTDVPASARYGNGVMSWLFQSDLIAAEQSGEGLAVISGCQLQAGTNAGTVKISAGTAMWGAAPATVSAQDNVACAANADTTNPRWALYELDNTGTLQCNLGTAATTPVPPTPTAGRVVVAAVLIPPNATTVSGASAPYADDGAIKIIDKRWFRASVAFEQFFQPIAAQVTNGVTYSTSTTITMNSNGTNLNTLTGTQPLNIASKTGLLTKGAVRVSHAGATHVVSYNGLGAGTGPSGEDQLLNCDSSPQGAGGGTRPSVVLSTSDPVSNAQIVTSTTANAFTAAHIGSYITGAAQLPTTANSGTHFGVIAAYGDAGAAGTWADITWPATSGATGLTFNYYQLVFSFAVPTWARYVRFRAIGGGGGGGSGSHVAATGSAAHGGGAGGAAGKCDIIMPAASLPSTLTITVGCPAPGGPGVTANGNGADGAAGQNTTLVGTALSVEIAGGGTQGSAGVTGGGAGGNNGFGNIAGQQDNYARAGSWSAPSGSTVGSGGKGADGTAPAAAQAGASTSKGPGAGGGGGGTSAANALQAAGDGGNGETGMGAFGSGNGGGSHGATVGANGGNGAGNSGDIANAPHGGGGGGGGAGANTSNTSGGNGGNGGGYGSGGAGGGNGIGTGTSGAGGTSGGGCALVEALP
jgi:hypothetical protein